MSLLHPSSALRRRMQALTGISCPVCLLAVVVTVALVAISAGAVVLDRVRAQQQAALAAKGIVDIARQRTVDLFVRMDATVRAVEEAVTATVATDAGRNQVETVIAQRRRAEPRLIALYLLDAGGSVVAGSTTTATRSGTIVPACLRDDRPDAEQVTLRAFSIEQTGAGALRGICIARGLRRDGFSGSVLAVIAADLLAGQFADLSIGEHAVMALLDENTRPLALISSSRPVVTNPGPAYRLPDWDAVLRGMTIDAATGSITEARRIDAPFGAVVAVVIPSEDALAVWQARTLLIASSTMIVLIFMALAVIAVKTCERRERDRLDRLAGLTLDMRSGVDALATQTRVVELACDLLACTQVPAGTDPAAQHARPPELTLPGAERVLVGWHVLTKHDGSRFTVADLTFLTVLSRIGAIQVGSAGRVAQTESAIDELKAAAETYRTGMEAVLLEMPDATFTLDGAWRFISSNRNADRLFGEYAEDIKGRSIWDVFPELDGTIFDTECRRALAGRHFTEFEMKWLRNETWLMVHVHPRAGGIVVYLQDISRQVATDDKLRQAAKMEAIGRLTGGIAHDFNNLLTVILGNIEMLDFELPETGESREMHDQIRRAAQSAAELTHQLLAFARRQPLSPSEVDVSRLVVGLDGLLRRTLGTSVTLEIQCAPSLWRARVDPTQLENAIVNLAINARDAIPAGRGGRLKIDANNIVIRKTDVDQWGELRPGNYVVVSVTDNGTGIPRELLGKVFEPFFTTKPAGRGTGLGLAMVYGYVTQSGGHVRIVSDEGRGTTVRLYLPGLGETSRLEALPAAPVPARPAAEPAMQQANGERILVVEDSEMVRGYTENVLTSLGYEVVSAPDGGEALALIDGGLRPDLLLTDVLLPNGMDGLIVAEQVLHRMPGLPVVYMSGYVENIDLHKSRLDPQVNLLLKPFRRASLAAMVRARLDNVDVR
ncbi:MAG: ATP-binding protein [Alphaproteobacteria bacterium]|nr:ATP-binding protein [Alphaproteobacteria bacterium]